MATDMNKADLNEIVKSNIKLDKMNWQIQLINTARIISDDEILIIL